MKMFKPMLAPNDTIEIDSIYYPLFSSYKLDGIRCIFIDGQMLSRSLKPIVNKQLQDKFEGVKEFTKETGCILDGELYGHGLSFQQITSFVMTEDFNSIRSQKKHGKILTLPDELMFYCFDVITDKNFMEPFIYRQNKIEALETLMFPNLIKKVNQKEVSSADEVTKHFDEALKEGYEGLILKSFHGEYKQGRGTLREGLIYKVKPYRTFDGQIIDVVQSTAVNEDAEKTVNELGNSCTSRKKGDRHLIDMACAFKVKYEDKEVKVSLAMTEDEKKEVWLNRENYINKWIEYKGMLIGAKDVPRHPVMLRFREDR